MIVKQLLDAKREGRELPADDIRALIAAYAKGEVPDYQMAAFAMAVCCRGMSDPRLVNLFLRQCFGRYPIQFHFRLLSDRMPQTHQHHCIKY